MEELPTTTTLESLIGEDDVASGAVKVTADSADGPLPQGATAAVDEFTDQQRDDDAEQSITTTTTTDLFWETTTTQTMLVLTDSTHDGADHQELERYNIELSSA